MNCFAHAIDYLDDPWFAIGTCMPDWLSMVDRKVRLRPKHIDPACDDSGGPADQLARGIKQHWEDDEWFHRTVAFHEVTSEVGVLFKNAHGSEDRFRSGFVGHIATEMLIDAVLSERNPGAMDRYYEAVESVEAAQVESQINSFGAKPTDRMQYFMQRYLEEQFLRDYEDNERCLYRLNRVLERVRLVALPDAACAQIGAAREIVRDRCDDLLRSPSK